MRPALYLGLALAAATQLAASCQRGPSGTAPDPTITAEPPPSPPATPPVQDPASCDGACAAAQQACKSHAPRPVDHCLAMCRAAAGALHNPSPACLAVQFTCDENCGES